MNYGAIGWVIGHEITHGFDDQGRQYNAEGTWRKTSQLLLSSTFIFHFFTGNLNNWWEFETFTKFLNKTRCVIQQYGNYSVDSLGIKLNGITTQGENIADNGGIKEAYRAYRKLLIKQKSSCIIFHQYFFL